MTEANEAASDGMSEKTDATDDIPVDEVTSQNDGNDSIPVDPEHGGVAEDVDAPSEEQVAGAVQLLRQDGKFTDVADYLANRLT